MIELHEVTVTVPGARHGEPERTILEPLSLTLSEQRICLIGANGSGKSTLLRLLNGLREPSTGTVLVKGRDTTRESREVRRDVAFIFSDPLAQLVMSTPIEDVELSLRRVLPQRSQRQARALELLERHGVGHVAHQSIYDLSGGERQLVALTSVLAVQPSILVADEPTTLLDLRNTHLLRAHLSGLPQQVIYSTHDLDFAADAERVILIDGGRIVADGGPAEVISRYRQSVSAREGLDTVARSSLPTRPPGDGNV